MDKYTDSKETWTPERVLALLYLALKVLGLAVGIATALNAML